MQREGPQCQNGPLPLIKNNFYIWIPSGCSKFAGLIQTLQLKLISLISTKQMAFWNQCFWKWPCQVHIAQPHSMKSNVPILFQKQCVFQLHHVACSTDWHSAAPLSLSFRQNWAPLSHRHWRRESWWGGRESEEGDNKANTLSVASIVTFLFTEISKVNTLVEWRVHTWTMYKSLPQTGSQ